MLLHINFCLGCKRHFYSVFRTWKSTRKLKTCILSFCSKKIINFNQALAKTCAWEKHLKQFWNFHFGLKTHFCKENGSVIVNVNHMFLIILSPFWKFEKKNDNDLNVGSESPKLPSIGQSDVEQQNWLETQNLQKIRKKWLGKQLIQKKFENHLKN